MQCRNPVDLVAGHHRKPSHAHAALAALLDQGNPAHKIGIAGDFGEHGFEELRVDVENDLQMARQEPPHHVDRPGFQRLAHQGVIGVAENLLRVAPGHIPGKAIFVKQQAHQLGDRQHRMRVVQVDHHLFRQLADVLMGDEIAVQDVVEAGRDKEVFLAQAQFLAGDGGIIRIQHARNVFGVVFVFDRRKVIALIELGQIDLAARFGRPQPQGVGRIHIIAGNDVVVGDRAHVLGIDPERLAGFQIGLQAPTKADLVMHLVTREFPDVERREPVIGSFDLLAVDDALLEHAVVVTDAIAKTGDAQRRHRIEKTRGEPPQTTIAERGIGFGIEDLVQIDLHFIERGLDRIKQLERQHSVEQRPADQKFHREVIHAARVLLVLRPRCLHPALNQLIAHGQEGRVEPIFGQGRCRVFTHGEHQLVGDRMFERNRIMAGGIVFKAERHHGLLNVSVHGTAPDTGSLLHPSQNHFASPRGARLSSLSVAPTAQKRDAQPG